MAAFLVGQITVKDEGLWRDYVSGVQESLEPFAAKILLRGQLDKILAGEHRHQLVVVIEFSDQPTLDNWFHSAKYQSLVSLRDQAADVDITSYRD